MRKEAEAFTRAHTLTRHQFTAGRCPDCKLYRFDSLRPLAYTDAEMRIACLGWGSLIWDPGALHLMETATPWHKDGPELPVEFARVSTNGRLTLVLVPGNGDSTPPHVLWAEMCCRDTEHARRNLAAREGVENNIVRSIPMWPTDGTSVPHWAAVDQWAKNKGFDFVIWTALRPRFAGQSGRVPSEAEALDYLCTLQASGRADAEEYIRRAPPQIETENRSAIEKILGWSYDGSKTDSQIKPTTPVV